MHKLELFVIESNWNRKHDPKFQVSINIYEKCSNQQQWIKLKMLHFQSQIAQSFGFVQMNSLWMDQMVESLHGLHKWERMAKGKWQIAIEHIQKKKTHNLLHFSIKCTAKENEYPDTAVINICSNVEYNPRKPIVYTSSTYLNIIGHQFTDESSDIFAKYSTLPIGMFALRVCPHDPNK